jgi:hypothetical protein
MQELAGSIIINAVFHFCNNQYPGFILPNTSNFEEMTSTRLVFGARLSAISLAKIHQMLHFAEPAMHWYLFMELVNINRCC